MAPLNKQTILVVDDEYFLAETIKTRLEYHGYQVLLAENGEEAIQKIESQPVDLVLMDLVMPILDGLSAIKRLREIERFKNLPIIAVTAKARESDRVESIATGANEYLSKPFDMEDMLVIIKKMLAQAS